MIPNTTHAAAAASGGFTGAAVVIICFILSKLNIEVPGEVSAAMMVVLTPIVHLWAAKAGITMPVAAARQ
jgi:hypothetical protein